MSSNLFKLKDLNWNHLYYFYELAKAQSLKEAAKIVGVSSPTLSEQLKKLESTLDSTLFTRSSKGLVLTNVGQELFERVQIIFEEGSKILERFSTDTVGGYPVKIGILETNFNDLAAEFCSQYWDLYTKFGTVNTVRQRDHFSLVENILNKQIDWGISLFAPKKEELNYAKIGSFEIIFCCSKKLYQKFKNVDDLLTNIPFAQSSWDKSLNKLVDHYLKEKQIIPKEKIFSAHQEFISKLCQRGRCVMFLPKNPLSTYPGLKTFQLESTLNVGLYAIWKKSDDALISIQKLQTLIKSKLTQLPDRYKDVDFQIEVSEVSQEMLN